MTAFMHRVATSQRRSGRGSVNVELAVSGVLVLAALLAVFDLGRMFYYQNRLEYAVDQSTRLAAAREQNEDAIGPAALRMRVDSITTTIRQLSGLAERTDFDVEVFSIGARGEAVSGAGGPGDIVTVTAHSHIDLITPYVALFFDEGRWAFSATTSFRNGEPSSAGSRPNAELPPKGV